MFVGVTTPSAALLLVGQTLTFGSRMASPFHRTQQGVPATLFRRTTSTGLGRICPSLRPRRLASPNDLGETEDTDSAAGTILKPKESTWDRLTGPKLFKTVTNWQGIHSVPLVPLRIVTGLLMIHHGSEGGVWPANVATPEFQGFVDYIVIPYFGGFLPGPPEVWSAIHDYAEFWGGILLAIGFLTRPAALALFASMIGAVYFHVTSTGLQGFPLGHVASYSYDFEEPMLYALIFLLFWFNGAVC